MPVYAYKCRECGTPLEVHQEFSDAPLTECPVCGGALRKQYGSIGVTFNGSGFYRTDSRSGGGGDAAKSETKSDGGSSGEKKSESTPGKTESKPAAAPSTPAS